MKTWIIAALMLKLTVLASDLEWRRLADMPDREGLAGAFVGVADGQLLFAGGTHFPDKMPWDGGTKVWYDQVYALKSPESRWRLVGRLPKPNGYGLSLSTDSGLICIGGGDARQHFTEVFRLRCTEDQIRTEVLPSLPQPCAMMASAQVGSVLYVLGGIQNPTDTQAMATFWSLDLNDLAAGWQTLPACPGPPRILASLGVAKGALYLVSGASLKPGPDGKAQREWLKDAWCYQPEEGWQPRADLPRVAVAAPSPLPWVKDRLLVLGGDDGALADFEPKAQHPGFPRGIQAFDPVTRRWSTAGELPFSIVTTPAVSWAGGIVIAGGEIRPGKRTPAVWFGSSSHR